MEVDEDVGKYIFFYHPTSGVTGQGNTFNIEYKAYVYDTGEVYWQFDALLAALAFKQVGKTFTEKNKQRADASWSDLLNAVHLDLADTQHIQPSLL